MTITWLEYIIVFVFGSAIGSFLNVVIYRVPVGKSIVYPGSFCPNCKRPVKPYENIPLLSYLMLRGKCAGCDERISPVYPLVEALTGLLAACLLARFGWSLDLLFYGVLTATLLALSVIDIKTFRLPNPIVLTGSVLAVILVLIRMIMDFDLPFQFEGIKLLSFEWFGEMTGELIRSPLGIMVIGGLTGLLLLGFMGLVGRLLFRKETLGMGDVKLAGMIGLYLGPYRTAGMFILGVFAGALIGIVLILMGGKKFGQRIPFGPYLALGGLISLLWGENLWRWYISLVLP